jgi:hypothetical protein
MTRIAFLFLAGALSLRAQDMAPPDEAALFQDTLQVVDSLPRLPAAAAKAEEKSLGISGILAAFANGAAERDYFGGYDPSRSRFSAGTVGDAFLDARLPRGFRAYAGFEWSLDASGSDSASFRVPETFFDANIGRLAWFRLGKQVLQWGPGWFFNPTDLINVERKTLVPRIGSREGVFGAKAQVPFGTAANLYGFLDAEKARRPDSLAGAVKAEFLLGRSEVAVMAWGGGGRDPVYGSDVSTRWLGLDITGEAALHSAFLTRSLDLSSGMPAVETEERHWQPRVAVGAGRGFGFAGIPERLRIQAEYYYNHPGSGDARMPFARALARFPAAGYTPEQAMAAAASYGLYEPNSFSRHYAAVTAAWSRFIRSSLTLTGNAIANLDQGGAMLAGILAYQDLQGFALNWIVYGFAGPKGTEYTLTDDAIQSQVQAEIRF